ncbi:MAG TPA: restriction endonuclease subunit S [Thermoanaerobaculia bacterium]
MGPSREWRQVRLGDLIEVKHGWPFKSELMTEELTGSPIVVNIGNFNYTGGFRFESTTLREYRGSYPEEYELQPGSILLVMTCQTAGGEILGIPARIPSDDRVYLHNQRLGKVVIREPESVDEGYLYYIFISQEFNRELFLSATGTKILHTSPSRIEAFRFYLPPIREQALISRVLGCLDDKIDLNRRMNQTLEAMARAIFKSWFVDFEPVPGQHPNFFLDSAHERVPSGWVTGEVGDIVEVIDCLHSKKPERRSEGRPLLQLANVLDNGLLDMEDTYWISRDDYELWTSRMEAREGDCVITNVGRVGAVAQVPANLKAALGRNMTGLRCRPTFPFPTFLIECLRSETMKEEIRRKTDSGTILESLNVRNIPKLRLVIPTEPVAREFERVCRPLRARMENNLEESRTLSALRDTLLPKLLSGEIRVKQAEKIVEEVV